MIFQRICLPELWLAFFLYFLIMFLFLFFLSPQCCSPRWPSKWSRNYRGRRWWHQHLFFFFLILQLSILWVPSSSRAIGKLLKKWLYCWEGWEVQQLHTSAKASAFSPMKSLSFNGNLSETSQCLKMHSNNVESKEMYFYTLERYFYTLERYFYTLEMYFYKLEMHFYTLVRYFYTFEMYF